MHGGDEVDHSSMLLPWRVTGQIAVLFAVTGYRGTNIWVSRAQDAAGDRCHRRLRNQQQEGWNFLRLMSAGDTVTP